MKYYSKYKALATLALLFSTNEIFAHVKWFSKYSFNDEPLQLPDVTNNLFWILTISSMVVVGLFTILDVKIQASKWCQKLDGQLNQHRSKSIMILRIATAVVLLMSWQLGTLVMPELTIQSNFLLWFQFLLAFLLIFRRTVPWAGMGMVVIYFFAIYKFGLFHMLDYFLLPGVAYLFITSTSNNKKIKISGLLLLYITLGFSLCWAGMEKLIYPEWGIYLLEKYPALALGLNPDLFVHGAAFIEISVGIMFILGYFQRVLAIVVTLLFILTSSVFGSKEVTGHLLIHASLIVFFIEGSGSIFDYAPAWYRKLGRNPLLAGISFAILLFAFLIPYTMGANQKYNEAMLKLKKEHPHNLEISDRLISPKVDFVLTKDEYEGWNVQIITENFTLQHPSNSSANSNIGYATLTINGDVAARIYSNWFYLPPQDKGTYNLEIYLQSSTHQQLTRFGLPIKSSHELIVE